MRSYFTLPDYITISNGILGFMALTYIIDGRFWISSILLIICIVLDGIDGALARKMKMEHNLGTDLDYFADIISFCMAPAILLYSNYYDANLGRAWESPLNAVATIVPTLIVIFGILRLGRHLKEGSMHEHFVGLPSPVIALITVLLTSLYGFEGILGYQPKLVLSVLFVLSILLYSKIPYPKIRRGIFFYSGSLFLCITFVGLVLAKISYPIGSLLLAMAVTATFGYIFIGPIMVMIYDR